jgi:5-deoxy-glucuronate isomerase
LNLLRGERHEISTGSLEMHPVLIYGKAALSRNDDLPPSMDRFDSFYLPSHNTVTVEAVEDCVFFIGGAKCEGIGHVSFRKFDPTLPMGDIHQIHGHGAGSREVMFTLDPGTPASRLICGLTWSSDGAWTSWPPHQHEKDLEEVYCYFDMPEPHFGFHLSYLESGKIEDCITHVVRSGTMVQAPKGYHPTVASPGTKNAYLWILVSFTPKSRRYDLAVPDPAYIP